MPPGARRRKAAKRKKEKETYKNNRTNDSSSINSNNSQGNDDPRSQDERESDGGEVDSPVSQDQNNHQHPFNEGNGESKNKGPLSISKEKSIDGVLSNAEESRNVGLEDDRVIRIERELDSCRDTQSRDTNVEHTEFATDSHDAVDKNSSSSSSDDEPHVFEKKDEEAFNSVLNSASFKNEEKEVDYSPEEVTEIEKPLKEANGDSVMETDLVTPVLPISGVVKPIMESAQFENLEVLDVIKSGLEEGNVKLLPTSEAGIKAAQAAAMPEKIEDKFFPIFEEDVVAPAALIGSTVNGNKDKNFVSLEDNFLSSSTLVGSTADGNNDNVFPIVDDDAVVDSTVDENKNKFHTLDENVMASPSVIGSTIDGNEVENVVTSSVLVGSTFDGNEDTSLVSSGVLSAETGNDAKHSETPGCTVNGNESKMLTSSAAHIAEASNSAEIHKDSDPSECSKAQPIITSAPRVAQQTSWMSCCGLFDVFSR